MICGVGIDLVENRRMEKIIEKWGGKFISRFFSDEEMEYCGKHAHPVPHYSARFAAKESFLKALGIGLGMGVKLSDISVANDQNGKPFLNLSGEAESYIREREITHVHLSLTHTKHYASAIVLLENKN